MENENTDTQVDTTVTDGTAAEQQAGVEAGQGTEQSGGDSPSPEGTGAGEGDRAAALLESLRNVQEEPEGGNNADNTQKEETVKSAGGTASGKAEQQDPKDVRQVQPEPGGNAGLEDVLNDVTTERAKTRIKQWIADHNRLEQEARATQETNTRFSELIRSTGMSPQELSQTVEFCRLSRSDSPDDLAVALELIESERQAIYDRLGKAAPGTDALAGFDDLRQAVEDMTITPEFAAEIAAGRRRDAGRIAREKELRQQQASQQARVQAYREAVQSFQQQAMGFFGKLKAQDPAYDAKEKVLMAQLTPQRMQEIAAKLPPDQWLFHLKGIYESITPVPQQPKRIETPIAARPQAIKKPAIYGRTNEEQTASVIQNYFNQ